MFGFKDGTMMREYGSPHHRVSEIKIPLLCLNAEDDPVCLGESQYIKYMYTQAEVTVFTRKIPLTKIHEFICMYKISVD